MADQLPPVIEERRGSFFSNFAAIIGLIVLIVIVIWGLTNIAGVSKGWFSSLFNRTPSIAVTAPAKVTSGTPFAVSWKYSTTENGNYAFFYQCRSGLTLKSGTVSIPCGASYTVGSATSLSFTANLQRVSSTTMPISIFFLPNATSSKRVQGSANIAVVSTDGETPVATPSENPTTTPVATKPTTPTPKPPPTTTPAPTNTVRTPADLAVRVLALGVIDRNTGMFVNRAPVYFDDIAAAQFDISNVGGSNTGTYYFSANLPTYNGYVYNSPPQMSLAPGEHIVNTLRWTNSAQVGTFTVSLVGDQNTINNYGSATIAPVYTPQQQPTYNYNNTYYDSLYYQQYTY